MKKLLLIEDDDDIQHILAAFLADSNFEILQARDGAVGLQLAQKHKPDLILCDLHLPSLDGYGILKALRQDANTAHILLIFLTAYSDRLSFRKAMELGADDYLTKPFQKAELINAIQACFDKRLYSFNLFEQKSKLMELSGQNANSLLPYTSNTSSVNLLNIEANLYQAMANAELQLYYQPQVDSRTTNVVGAEVLLHWKHPQHGFIPQANFIPLVEISGLTELLGEWVLSQVCQQARHWELSYNFPIRLAFNVSGQQLKPRLVEKVAQLLQQSGLKPGSLELELSESSLIDDMEGTIEIMHTLQSLGVSLALDDFGTGFSSLNYLKRLPLNTLKIDRAFVHDCDKKAHNLVIVRAIIKIAHHFGLKTVAEGVETFAEHKILIEEGCDEFQGYFIGMPMPLADFKQWVTHQRLLTIPLANLIPSPVK